MARPRRIASLARPSVARSLEKLVAIVVRAEVEASITDLAGRSIDVPMREVVGNGMESYPGTFDFAPRQVLDFRIVARPHPDGAPITLEFRDRMWVP